MPPSEDFADLLRESALRVTRPRVAVLSAVYRHPHASTDAVIDAVRGGTSPTSPTRPSTTRCTP